MQKVIWTYWENVYQENMQGYVQLGIESMKLYAGMMPDGGWEVIVITPDNVNNYISNLRNDYLDIPEVAHRADYIRAACIAENGGMWMDADILIFKPLTLLTDILEDPNGGGAVFYGYRSKEPSIGTFAAKPGHPLLVRWLEGINKQLNEKLAHKWAGIGYDVLWPLVKSENIQYTHLAHPICAPIVWNQTDKFLDELLEPADLLWPNTVMIQLYNKNLFRKMGGLSKEEILSSPTLLGKFARLSIECPQVWVDAANHMHENLNEYINRAVNKAKEEKINIGNAYIDLAHAEVKKALTS